jgi:hypothetical protein
MDSVDSLALESQPVELAPEPASEPIPSPTVDADIDRSQSDSSKNLSAPSSIQSSPPQRHISLLARTYEGTYDPMNPVFLEESFQLDLETCLAEVEMNSESVMHPGTLLASAAIIPQPNSENNTIYPNPNAAYYAARQLQYQQQQMALMKQDGAAGTSGTNSGAGSMQHSPTNGSHMLSSSPSGGISLFGYNDQHNNTATNTASPNQSNNTNTTNNDDHPAVLKRTNTGIGAFFFSSTQASTTTTASNVNTNPKQLMKHYIKVIHITLFVIQISLMNHLLIHNIVVQD